MVLTELSLIDQIKITLVTNTSDKKQVVLTKDVIYHPLLKDIRNTGVLNNYPYITGEIVYDAMFLNSMTYDRRIRFFFDKDNFKDVILTYMKNIDYSKVVHDPTKYRELNDNINTNIEIMLRVLFTTVYPVVGNNYSSYERYLLRENPSVFDSFDTTSLTKYIPKPLRFLSPSLSAYYSYLKFDGQIHTITRSVWLNDFINHPIYEDLMRNFNRFIQFKEKAKKRIDADISKYFDKIKQIIETLFHGNNTFKKNGKKDNVKFNNIQDISDELLTTLTKFEEIISNAITVISREKQLLNDKMNDIGIIIKHLMDRYHIYMNDNTAVNTKSLINTIVELNQYLIQNKNAPTNTQIIIPQEIKNPLTQLGDAGNKLNILNIIKYKYFDENINTNFDDDEPVVKEEFNSKYKEYKDFIINLNKLVEPNNITTNEELQDIIYTYTQGLPSHYKKIQVVPTIHQGTLPLGVHSKNSTNQNLDFGSLMKYVYDVFIKNKQKSKISTYLGEKFKVDADVNINSLLKIDATYIENSSRDEPKYNIYVAVDLIKGELNETNQQLINCSYQGENLAVLFDRNKNKKRFNPYQLYQMKMFDIKTDGHVDTQGQVIKPAEVEKTSNQVEQPRPIQAAAAAGGGTRKYYRKYHRNTRKNR